MMKMIMGGEIVCLQSRGGFCRPSPTVCCRRSWSTFQTGQTLICLMYIFDIFGIFDIFDVFDTFHVFDTFDIFVIFDKSHSRFQTGQTLSSSSCSLYDHDPDHHSHQKSKSLYQK